VSRRRGGASIAGSPVLIGALTTLVVIVAVFLSYNANSGLPFVPTYDVSVELPDAANLVDGNDVRIGGFRVGAVNEITPVRRPDGTAYVKIKLALQKSVEKLPRDTTIIVRSRSALGLKYVEITPGKKPSKSGYPAGGTIPISQAKPEPVEFDQVINTFDKPTRVGQQRSLLGIGDALAGRGTSLNATIAILPELLGNLEPVMENLSNPRTQLNRLFPALERTAAILAPVADVQADLFVNLDTTFTALARVARPYIQDTIAEGPATLDTSIRSFRVQRPFLEDSTRLFNDLAPGVRALRDAAPTLSDALRIGRPVLLRTPALDRRLTSLLLSLKRFATDSVVPRGVADLTDTVKELRPTLAFLKPAQTTCNYISDWFRNVSDLLTVGDASGTTQRFIIIATPQGVNNEGGPASAPANGPGANYLHVNPYPYTASPGQPHECEAGNETFVPERQQIGNTPGHEPASTDLQP
jgi:virulence factor Mce-like protein